MTVPYIVSGKTITLYLDGMPQSVEDDHPFYARIVGCLKDGDEVTLRDLLENPVAGVAEFKDGKVLYGGSELHNVLVDRIMEQVSLGLPADPMLRFLENLMQNPSETSRQELYEFLAHSYLPITEDGHFLGYKAVRANYKDIHSGKFDNSVGKVIEMPRGDVDPDRHNHCSQGFHVGTMEYVRSFGGRDSRFLLVKVNPRDAVSVPADHGAQKLRCCKYEVVREIERDQVLTSPAYSSDGSAALESELCYDEDWWDDDADWDSDYEEWESGATKTDLDLEEEKQEYREDRTAWYQEHFTRDEVVEECFSLGLIPTKETGRRLRKEGCIALLVGADCKEFFS